MEKKKSYTIRELADMYDVSPKTMRNWIKPIRSELLKMNEDSQKRLRILLPRQMKRIIEFLG